MERHARAAAPGRSRRRCSRRSPRGTQLGGHGSNPHRLLLPMLTTTHGRAAAAAHRVSQAAAEHLEQCGGHCTTPPSASKRSALQRLPALREPCAARFAIIRRELSTHARRRRRHATLSRSSRDVRASWFGHPAGPRVSAAALSSVPFLLLRPCENSRHSHAPRPPLSHVVSPLSRACAPRPGRRGGRGRCAPPCSSSSPRGPSRSACSGPPRPAAPPRPRAPSPCAPRRC